MGKSRPKLYLSILLIFVLIFAIGCSSKQEPAPNTPQQQAAEKTALDKIKEAGVITAGISPDYPPFETVDDKGNIVGFDIDLLNAIAEELGVKPEIKNMGFDTIITAVQNAQVDIGISGFSISDDRKEKIDFSIPYWKGGQVVVVAPNSGITSIDQLKGKVVATGMGTTCAEVAREEIKDADVKELDTFNTAFMMLKNGSASAVVADLAVANEYIAKDNFVALGEPLNFEENAIVIKKGNPELVEALNQAIKKLQDNGKITEFAKKWGMQ